MGLDVTNKVSSALPRCEKSDRITSVNGQPDAVISEQDHFWRSYKDTFLRVLPGGRGTILIDESGFYTPSEGMGHAMFFAAERRDWKTLDSLIQGLSNFKKANGLFRWKINPDGSFPPEDENLNCSTETEQNVSGALLLAYERTGKSEYKNLALDILDSLWRNATVLFQGRRILLPADLTENRYWPLVFNEEGIPCKPSKDGINYRSGSIQKVVWSPSCFSPDMEEGLRNTIQNTTGISLLMIGMSLRIWCSMQPLKIQNVLEYPA